MTSSCWADATALLTGASRGIGPFIARALAAEGIHLALSATPASREGLYRLAESLRTSGIKTAAITAELTDSQQRAMLIDRVHGSLGRIDILVNNAGVENPGVFTELSDAAIRQVIDTNLTAPLSLARQILPGMRRRRRGAIVNVASLAGHIPMPTIAVYAASKAGLIAWTEAMASELEPGGVKVAAVCPTFVSGEGMHARTGVRAPWIAGEVTPERVARAVVTALDATSHHHLVTPRPTRPLLALLALMPGLGQRLKRSLGLNAFMFRRSG